MTEVLRFGPFRLDLATARVWRGSQALKLTAKALAVLRYLADFVRTRPSRKQMLKEYL